MCPSNEFFTLVNGEKVDAPLHEPILNNPKADKASREESVKMAIEMGVDPEVARRAYGTTPET